MEIIYLVTWEIGIIVKVTFILKSMVKVGSMGWCYTIMLRYYLIYIQLK